MCDAIASSNQVKANVDLELWMCVVVVRCVRGWIEKSTSKNEGTEQKNRKRKNDSE